jgi:hypothetical protein
VERALSYKKSDEREEDYQDESVPEVEKKREKAIGGKKLLDRRDLSRRTSKKSLDRMYRFSHLLPWWFRAVAYGFCLIMAVGNNRSHSITIIF